MNQVFYYHVHSDKEYLGTVAFRLSQNVERVTGAGVMTLVDRGVSIVAKGEPRASKRAGRELALTRLEAACAVKHDISPMHITYKGHGRVTLFSVFSPTTIASKGEYNAKASAFEQRIINANQKYKENHEST
jgi:hypothetical protein